MSDGSGWSDADHLVKAFRVEGFVGGERVEAVYADRLLRADSTLMDRAHVALLVDEAFGDLRPHDVGRWLLTFAKALDRVSHVTYDLELRHPVPPDLAWQG